ncbi:fibronectin type III domain-containing protein [bacterium]|nr:fibronectin type III domain-containing protein [bacterium]
MSGSKTVNIQTECPVCGFGLELYPSIQRKCANCEFDVDGETVSDNLLKSVDKAESSKDLNLCLHFIEYLEKEGLAGKKEQLRKKNLSNLIKSIDTNVVLPITKKNLYDADRRIRDALSVASNTEFSGKLLSEWSKYLTSTLNEISVKLARASKVESVNPDEAFDLYSTILSICIDCKDAKNGLKRCPPNPPSDVTPVRITDEEFEVSWLASHSIGEISYHIVRKEGSPPTSEKDGRVIAKTKSLRVRDTVGLIAGVSYYYSVIAIRESVPSAPATTTEAIVPIREIKNIEIKGSDGKVEATWSAPDKCTGIKVVRNTRKPLHIADGVNVPAAKQKFSDSKVINGAVYYYLIVCEYTDCSGRIILSNGVSASAKPNYLPSITDKLSLDVSDNKVLLRWNEIDRGKLYLIQSDSGFPYRKDELFPSSLISSIGKQLGDTRLRNWASLKNLEPGLYYIGIVTEYDGFARMGPFVAFEKIGDIKDVSTSETDKDLYIRWEWPTGCKRVSVRFSEFDLSETYDTATRHLVISNREYHMKGGLKLPLKGFKELFIELRQGSAIDNPDVKSLNDLLPTKIHWISESKIKTILFWRVFVKQKLFSNKFEYQIIIHSKNITYIPDILVVCRNKYMPTKISDGKIIGTICATHLGASQKIKYEIEPTFSHTNQQIALFFSDPVDYTKFELLQEE